MFGGGSETTTIQYVIVERTSGDSYNGWVQHIYNLGQILAFEWYDPENPTALNRQEISIDQIREVKRGEWVEITSGERPPSPPLLEFPPSY